MIGLCNLDGLEHRSAFVSWEEATLVLKYRVTEAPAILTGSSVISSQITFCLGAITAVSASFWFNVQPLDGRNAVYATAVLMGSGGSVMLITSLSMIAQLIGQDKVREKKWNAQKTEWIAFNVDQGVGLVLVKVESYVISRLALLSPPYPAESCAWRHSAYSNRFSCFSRQKSGAFVYGVIGFFDKVVSGLVVVVIQECNPRTEQS